MGVPGAVVVAARPGFSWERAVGIADLSSEAPMTLDHRFRIASVTKPFVAVAVLQLVEEGALELDGEVDVIAGASPFGSCSTTRAVFHTPSSSTSSSSRTERTRRTAGS